MSIAEELLAARQQGGALAAQGDLVNVGMNMESMSTNWCGELWTRPKGQHQFDNLICVKGGKH